MKVCEERPFGFGLCVIGLLLSLSFMAVPVVAAEDGAFSNKFIFRLAYYSVSDADTDISVLNENGIGTGVNFSGDLGGESTATIPRIDMYYRFNEKHRIDFAMYTIKRHGNELLQIDIDWEDQSYSIGERIVTDIRFDLLKLGYGYTVYHSPKVEINVTAGLNITGYDFDYRLANGSKAGTSDASAPLPMFGLRVSYALTPKWSIHYLSETFFVDFENELTGAFLNYELDLRYRAGENILFGVGTARLSIDLKSDAEDWRGRIADSHRGILFYVGYQI